MPLVVTSSGTRVLGGSRDARFDAKKSAVGAIDRFRHAIMCFGILKRLDHTLDIPTWTKPALNGAVVGAIAWPSLVLHGAAG